MSRRLVAGGFAIVLACAGACSRGADTPVSPSSTEATESAANPDGSTLKATAPELRSPVGGGQLDTIRPTLVSGVSQARFVSAQFSYRFELSTPSGTVVHTSPLVAASGGQAIYEVPSDLDLNTRYRWRARAEMGTNAGPWAGYAEFITDDYRGLVPRPPDGNWPRSGPEVINYIRDSFPERLRRTSLEERIANMAFLRDRIIEAGVCGGLDLARNIKRGKPGAPHSIDALAWKLRSGKVEVVDLASAYDDERQPLRLHWFVTLGPPGYDPMPEHRLGNARNPGC